MSGATPEKDKEQQQVHAARAALERLHDDVLREAPERPPSPRPAVVEGPTFPHGIAPASPGDMGLVIGESVKGAIAAADDKLESMVKQGMAGVSHAMDRLMSVGGGGGEEEEGEGKKEGATTTTTTTTTMDQQQQQQQQQPKPGGGGKGDKDDDSMEKVLLMSPSPREPSAPSPADLAARWERERVLAAPVASAGSPQQDEAAAERATEHARELAASYFGAKALMEKEKDKKHDEQAPQLGGAKDEEKAYHPTPSHTGRTSWAPSGEPCGLGLGGGTGYPSGAPGKKKAEEEEDKKTKTTTTGANKQQHQQHHPHPELPLAGAPGSASREVGEAVAGSLGALAGASASAALHLAEGVAEAAGRVAGHAAAAPQTAAENAGYVSGAAVRVLAEDVVPAFEVEAAPFDDGAIVHEREIEQQEREAEKEKAVAELRRRAADEARAARLKAEWAAQRRSQDDDDAHKKDQQQQQQQKASARGASHSGLSSAAEDAAHAAGLAAGHAADVLSHALEAVGLGSDEPPPPAEIVASTEEILAKRGK